MTMQPFIPTEYQSANTAVGPLLLRRAEATNHVTWAVRLSPSSEPRVRRSFAQERLFCAYNFTIGVLNMAGKFAVLTPPIPCNADQVDSHVAAIAALNVDEIQEVLRSRIGAPMPFQRFV